MDTTTRTCPTCGEATYRCLTESFGSTGSMHTTTVHRHESTGRIACPRKEA